MSKFGSRMSNMKGMPSNNYPSVSKRKNRSTKSIKLAASNSYDCVESNDDSYYSSKTKNRRKKESLKTVKQSEDARSGYVFAVKVKHNDGAVWNFVDFSYGGTTLRVSSTITSLLPKITSEMQEIWKRIVIDDVYSWDNSYVDPKTLRLVRVTLGCEDATLGLFADESDMREKFRLAALSRLSGEEARLINVDKKHSILLMVRDPLPEQRDSDLTDIIRADMSTDLVEQAFTLDT